MTKLEFKLDYITSSGATYKTLGVSGGDGKMISGDATKIVGFNTSLTENFKKYNLTTNSPATDGNYTTNGNYPDWIYEVWYEVTVDATAFGTSGFGSPMIASVHASPSKTGSNTEVVEPGTCPASLTLGNLVWNDVNGNGIREADEAGVGGVTVRLYTDSNGDNIADNNTPISSVITNADGTYKFTGLGAGKYIAGVVIPSGYTVSPTSFSNPDNDVNNDNNAHHVVNNQAEIRSNYITLLADKEPTEAEDGDDANGNLTLDLAICGRSNLGDFVFNDLNKNGIQNSNEPGIKNVKVTLTYPDGTSTSTTTDADGKYLFINLGPGVHKVTFTTPTGFDASPANEGTNDAIDSDPVNGTVSVTVAADVDNLTIDAGFNKTPVKLTLGNQVWNDKDGDGRRDGNEEGIIGITVSLYTDTNADNQPDGPAIKTTETDSKGKYSFTELPEGRYIVSIPVIAGYTPSPSTRTSQNANPALNTSQDPDNNEDDDNNAIYKNAASDIVFTHAITLTNGLEPDNSGKTNNTLDLALCGNGGIGDFVWNDTNGNGIQDAGEAGINGVKVTITFADGTTDTHLTHNYVDLVHNNSSPYDGYYDFINLGGGTFTITFETPKGYSPSPAKQGGDDTKDSDPVNGSTTVTLAPDGSNFNVDAGFTKLTHPPIPSCPNLSLGNMVFKDLNGDGKKDATEPGIGKLTVKLYADANGDNVADGPAVSTVMTAKDGTYYFGNLAAGQYIVGVTLPDSLLVAINTYTNPDDNIDDDNNGVRVVNGEVQSNFITLAAGSEPIDDGSDNNSNLTLDFGLRLRKTAGARIAASEAQSVVTAITAPVVNNTSVSVFPNPANDFIIIKVMAVKAGKGLARITDATGKLVATKTAVINNGLNLIKFDNLEGLHSGNYFVQLDFDYHTYNHQLIVVK